MLPFFPPHSHMRRPAKLFCATLALAAIAACTQPPPPAPPPPIQPVQPPPPPQYVPTHPLTGEQPGFLRLGNIPEGHTPVRVGVLLPFTNGSSSTRALAASMMKAAQMALFDSRNSDIILIAGDEGSTPGQAASATRTLLAEGAEIIVGPLFSQSATAVAPIARDHAVPVISFSSDRSVAGDDVYLLSFQPENEVHRIVSYAAQLGHINFAAIVPDTAYGDRVAQAFAKDVQATTGAHITQIGKFEPGGAGIPEAAKAVADSKPDAILIAQGGALLHQIAATLGADGAGNRNVQLLGTGVWDDPDNEEEPALAGGWFTAPAHESHREFEARYHAIFDSNPAQLATLAYDAVSLVARLSSGPPYHRFTPAAIVDPNGFAGVDGIFRFNPDGSSQRGLAILNVEPGGFQITSPAPRTFEGLAPS